MDLFAGYLWSASLAILSLGLVIGAVWHLGTKAEDSEGRKAAAGLMSGAILLAIALAVLAIATVHIDTIGVL